jgi:hypothetical protein
LGHLKILRIDDDERFSTPRSSVVEHDNTGVTRHISEEVTDQKGQVRKSSVHAGPNENSDNEEHNLGLERRRRALKDIARRISEAIRRERVNEWFFAATSDINGAIVKELGRDVGARLVKNVHANLTKLGKDDVLAHFYDRKTGQPGSDDGASRRADKYSTGRKLTLQSKRNTAGMTGPRRAGRSQDLKSRDRLAGVDILSNQTVRSKRNARSAASLNRSNVRRKPSARRTSPFKKMMRKEKISQRLAAMMRNQHEKGDRRRTVAERKLTTQVRRRETAK